MKTTSKKGRGKKLAKQQIKKPTQKVNINQNKPTNIYTVLMNEGVKIDKRN